MSGSVTADSLESGLDAKDDVMVTGASLWSHTHRRGARTKRLIAPKSQ